MNELSDHIIKFLEKYSWNDLKNAANNCPGRPTKICNECPFQKLMKFIYKTKESELILNKNLDPNHHQTKRCKNIFQIIKKYMTLINWKKIKK
jgi:hypothetical protein